LYFYAGGNMGDYVCTRVWQLRQESSYEDVEVLASSSLLEMLRWIPGVKRFSLCRVSDEPGRLLMTMIFMNYQSYRYWRLVEAEAADYWEHFAAVLAHWEQLCQLVEEYAGDVVTDVSLEENRPSKG
jgi:hypothetical protein